jgi:hypothetical protein
LHNLLGSFLPRFAAQREIIKVSVELLNCRRFGGRYFFGHDRKVCQPGSSE